MLILHSYGFEGHFNNSSIQSIIKLLCKRGYTIHIMAQEFYPKSYDFISTVYKYHKNSKIEKIYERKIAYSGRVILHIPYIGKVLPTYNEEKNQFLNSALITRVEDFEIGNYLTLNSKVANYIIKKFNIKKVIANDSLLSGIVAKRVAKINNIDYFVISHLYELNCAIKKQDRFYNIAKEVLSESKAIFLFGKEILEELKKIFLGDLSIEEKITLLSFGVDTELFNIKSDNKRILIKKLEKTLPKINDGNNQSYIKVMLSKIDNNITKKELISILKKYNNYDKKTNDLDIIEKLNRIDFEKDKIIITMGELNSKNGIHNLITSLPFVLKQKPNIKIIIIGSGFLREVIEVMFYALRNNYQTLFEHIINWGKELEFEEKKESYQEIKEFFKQLDIIDIKDEYFINAIQYLKEDTLIFTGHLTLNQLKYLIPLGDIAVFPALKKSISKGLLETVACGLYPIATKSGENEQLLIDINEIMKGDDGEWMKIKPRKESIISDIIRNIPRAIDIADKYKNQLSKLMNEKYSWSIVIDDILYEIEKNRLIEI